jgi:hypothetical protein
VRIAERFCILPAARRQVQGVRLERSGLARSVQLQVKKVQVCRFFVLLKEYERAGGMPRLFAQRKPRTRSGEGCTIGAADCSDRLEKVTVPWMDWPATFQKGFNTSSALVRLGICVFDE